MKLLKDRVGETINGCFPSLYPNKVISAKLHAVEETGIWIECEEMTRGFLEGAEQSAYPATPVLFVPFVCFGWIIGYVPRPCRQDLGKNVVPVHFGSILDN